MSIRYLIILAGSLIFAGNAFAEEGEVLAKKNSCLTCHTKKGPGPTFKQVADKYNKYSNKKDAQATLEKKVRSGSVGVWGKIPMAPTPRKVSDEDIKSIVQWVLSIK